jgi:hypothetical protein
MDPTKMDP